jgi:predicted amidohydrolase YtcJ
MKPIADLILQNGRITTLDPSYPSATEIVVVGDKFAGVDNTAEFERGPQTKVIDLQRRRVVPGLYDSHLHVIRGGLNYNMELRWEGVPSLSLPLQMLREQAVRTPAPQWVRVVGGWTEFQFVERRMPTLDEINAAASDTPVFAKLGNRGAERLTARRSRPVATPRIHPIHPGGEIVRDKAGNPTGMLQNPLISKLSASSSTNPAVIPTRAQRKIPTSTCTVYSLRCGIEVSLLANWVRPFCLRRSMVPSRPSASW